MIYRYLILTVLVLVCACTSEVNPGEMAGQTAKAYYDLLLEGKYGDFVAGMEGCDSIDDEYRDQLILNAQMFVEQQKTEHKGMKSLELQKCDVDTAAHSATAMIRIVFNDNLSETIAVPMTERNGVWYMK